jgi:hypothetical protein
MIISFLHSFIYIRTRKTASSTIEALLKENLGPDDLFVGKGRIRKLRPKEIVCQEGLSPDTVAGHMGATEIMSILPEGFWNSCIKFTSERHPYEKAVSLASFNFNKLKNNGRAESYDFDRFLEKVIANGSYRSFDLYSVDGRVVVDDFIQYDTLHADLRRIGARLGIVVPDELPKKNTAFRSDRRPASEILSDVHKRMIFEHCRDEFELFGYTP